MTDTVAGQGGDLINVANVAEILSVSQRTVAKFEKEDPTFPKAFKMNARIVKYSKTAVIAWLQSKQEQPE